MGARVMPAGFLGMRFESQPAFDDGFRIAEQLDRRHTTKPGSNPGASAGSCATATTNCWCISSRPGPTGAGSTCACAFSTTASVSGTKCRASPGTPRVNITDELTEFRLDPELADHGLVDSGAALQPLRIPLPDDVARRDPHGAHADDRAPAERAAPELPRGGARRLCGVRDRPAPRRRVQDQPDAVVGRRPRQDQHAVQDAVAHGAGRADTPSGS